MLDGGAFLLGGYFVKKLASFSILNSWTRYTLDQAISCSSSGWRVPPRVGFMRSHVDGWFLDSLHHFNAYTSPLRCCKSNTTCTYGP